MEYRAQFPIEFVSRIDSIVPRSALEAYAGHRLFFALRRFRSSIRKVTVRLTDQNGPRHGVDIRCVIAMHLHQGGALLVEATSAWPTAAITAAAGRLTRTMRRRLARQHARHRRAAA